jgi:hypothetical protein
VADQQVIECARDLPAVAPLEHLSVDLERDLGIVVSDAVGVGVGVGWTGTGPSGSR